MYYQPFIIAAPAGKVGLVSSKQQCPDDTWRKVTFQLTTCQHEDEGCACGLGAALDITAFREAEMCWGMDLIYMGGPS